MTYQDFVNKNTIKYAAYLDNDIHKWSEIFYSLNIDCSPRPNTLVFNCPVCGVSGAISLCFHSQRYDFPTWRCRTHNLSRQYYNSYVGLIRMFYAEKFNTPIKIHETLKLFYEKIKTLYPELLTVKQHKIKLADYSHNNMM